MNRLAGGGATGRATTKNTNDTKEARSGVPPQIRRRWQMSRKDLKPKENKASEATDETRTDTDGDKEQVWAKFGIEQFAKGYTASDNLYDNLRAG